jgi:hypothetical protein
MKVEITVLNNAPDWYKTDLPVGIYFYDNTLYFYIGNNTYPFTYVVNSEILGILLDKDQPVKEKTEISMRTIAVDDLVKILVAARANPDNLPGQFLMKPEDETKR